MIILLLYYLQTLVYRFLINVLLLYFLYHEIVLSRHGVVKRIPTDLEKLFWDSYVRAKFLPDEFSHFSHFTDATRTMNITEKFKGFLGKNWKVRSLHD